MLLAVDAGRLPEGHDLVDVEPQQRLFGGGDRAAQERRYSVADLLQHLPLAALEFKPVMEGLQPGGLAER